MEEKEIIEKKQETNNNLNLDLNNLTFIDGIILTDKIYNMVLEKHLTDKNGEDKTDSDGYSYQKKIDEDIWDLLFDQVLIHKYHEHRKDKLIKEFKIEYNV